MARLGEAWRRLTFSFRRNQMERDLAEEMRDHLARKAEKNAAVGMSGEDARYAAQRQLGNATLQQEESRASWGFPALESLLQDARYGLRGLRKSPGFSVVAIMTLALGIGATTAIFSIVNSIVLRPLPFKDSERTVNIETKTPMFPDFSMGVTKPDFDDVKSQARSFEALTLFRDLDVVLTGSGEPEQIRAAGVAPDFLSMFGLHPERGRDIQDDDLEAKNGNVVLLSHGLWQRKFGGDEKVLGRAIHLDGKPYTIAGVLPKKFDFGYAVLVPLAFEGDERTNRTSWMNSVYAKLHRGTRLETAQAELDRIAAQLGVQHPKEESGMHLKATLLQDQTVANSKSEFMMLLGAVGFLLLIASANVGNLILARGTERQREISVRAALGASRGRIARQLLVESLLLALLGGGAGMILAILGVDGFKALAPASIPRLDELHLEPAIAGIGLLISTFAGVLCGLAPALQTSRPDLAFALKDRGAASSSNMRQSWLRSGLVISEVALALVLLAGSALMVESLVRTLKVDAGFRTDHLLTAQLNLPAARYPSPEARRLFVTRLLAELHAHPELAPSALSNFSTLDNRVYMRTFDPKTIGIDEKPTNLLIKSVDPAYFATLGIPVRSGRVFGDRDIAGAGPVLVINESFARRFFPNQDPLGKYVPLFPKERAQIVGVVADVHDVSLKQRPKPQVYLPLLQSAHEDSLVVFIRTTTDRPEQLASSLLQSVWTVDKDLAVTKVRSLTAVISQSVAESRFSAWLLSIFAFSGLALTLIGIYGVISYSVGQRTQEIGIRLALGAQPENVLRLILTQGLRLTLLGTAAGIIATFALTRVLANQLFGVKPSDPATLIGAVLLMFVVAMLASYLPARRATQVDPIIALRQE